MPYFGHVFWTKKEIAMTKPARTPIGRACTPRRYRPTEKAQMSPLRQRVEGAACACGLIYWCGKNLLVGCAAETKELANGKQLWRKLQFLPHLHPRRPLFQLLRCPFAAVARSQKNPSARTEQEVSAEGDGRYRQRIVRKFPRIICRQARIRRKE